MGRSSNIGSRTYTVCSPKRPDLPIWGPHSFLFSGYQVAGRGVCHSCSHGAEVKNEWVRTSTPSMPTCHGQDKLRLHIYVYSCHNNCDLLATSMEQNPSSETKSHLTGEAALSVLWDRNVRSRVYKFLSLVPTLRQKNPLHTVQLCFFKINLNIIPPPIYAQNFPNCSCISYFPVVTSARIIFSPVLATFPPHLILRVFFYTIRRRVQSVNITV